MATSKAPARGAMLAPTPIVRGLPWPKIIMAYVVMAYIVLAYTHVAYVRMACVVMAYIIMAPQSYRPV